MSTTIIRHNLSPYLTPLRWYTTTGMVQWIWERYNHQMVMTDITQYLRQILSRPWVIHHPLHHIQIMKIMTISRKRFMVRMILTDSRTNTYHNQVIPNPSTWVFNQQWLLHNNKWEWTIQESWPTDYMRQISYVRVRRHQTQDEIRHSGRVHLTRHHNKSHDHHQPYRRLELRCRRRSLC